MTSIINGITTTNLFNGIRPFFHLIRPLPVINLLQTTTTTATTTAGTTTTTSGTTTPAPSSGVDTGSAVGIAVGVIIALLVLGIGGYFLKTKWWDNREYERFDEETAP